MSNNEHTPKPLVSDVAWAARESKDWLHELFRDRDQALTALRMGALSESFQERVRRWKARTTLTIGRLRVTGPVLVGASVAVYSALSQAGLVDTVARGLLAAVLTHLAILVLPFAVLAALPVGLFLLLRLIAAANVPEPPALGPELAHAGERAQPTAEQEPAPALAAPSVAPPAPAPLGSQPERSDPTAGDRPNPNGVLLARFKGEDRSLLVRLLESDGLFMLRDKESLAIVSRWVAAVRDAQQKLTALKTRSARLETLDGFVRREVLFELGLFDGLSYGPAQTDYQNFTEADRIAAAERLGDFNPVGMAMATAAGFTVEIYADGSNNAELRDDLGEPTGLDGQLKLVSPAHHGYSFLPRHALDRMGAPPLTCGVVRDIVHRYVDATDHVEVIRSWQVLKNTAPYPNAHFLTVNNGRDIDLQSVEDAVLAGEVRDTTARRLAEYYGAFQAAVEEYEDYVAHQMRVAILAKWVLMEAHKVLRANDEEQRAARIAARRSGAGNPYDYLDTSRTPVKTREQRRAEIEALVRAAVPTTRREW